MINLNAPLRVASATPEERAMLADLQGNILKGHGRKATRHLFLKFNADVERARRFIRDVEPFVTSAATHLQQAAYYKATRTSQGPFLGFMLSAAGYRALGLEALMPDDGGAFAEGMRRRRELLLDPEDGQIDPGYRSEIHAALVIGGEPDSPDSWTSTEADDLETRILNLMAEAAEVVASEAGRAIFDHRDEGLEHFGYVDGRSQPLMIVEDIEAENQRNGGADKWDPAFPLKQTLVRDRGSASDVAFGSFFVFRKLEQNVKAFKAAEAAIGAAAGNGELAGATIVGRWEDGTSVLLFGQDGEPQPIQNNFNYDEDPAGARCPVHAHIRKTNPRGESTKLGATLEEERSHIMARRGITYGRRSSIKEPQDEPEGGVGLLFMAFQSDIANQFEFTQRFWANNENFVDLGTGIDPIIGQGPLSTYSHPKVWGDPAGGFVTAPFGGHVAFKGGEYFFAPAKTTLAGV